jgi:hypothetical protein
VATTKVKAWALRLLLTSARQGTRRYVVALYAAAGNATARAAREWLVEQGYAVQLPRGGYRVTPAGEAWAREAGTPAAVAEPAPSHEVGGGI